eukprot:796931_1
MVIWMMKILKKKKQIEDWNQLHTTKTMVTPIFGDGYGSDAKPDIDDDFIEQHLGLKTINVKEFKIVEKQTSYMSDDDDSINTHSSYKDDKDNDNQHMNEMVDYLLNENNNNDDENKDDGLKMPKTLRPSS